MEGDVASIETTMTVVGEGHKLEHMACTKSKGGDRGGRGM